MKKAATGCFVVACVAAVLVAILLSLGSVREGKIRDSSPITAEELQALSHKVVQPTPPPQAPSETEPETATGTAFSAEAPRLARAATEDEQRAYFTGGRSTRAKVISFLGTSPLGGAADLISVAAGRPEGESFNRADVNLIRGNCADAKYYFSEYVRKSSDVSGQRVAYAHLAWLEDDPELATRYMELAGSGEGVYPLHLNVELARKTGSERLANHYEARFLAARQKRDSEDK